MRRLFKRACDKHQSLKISTGLLKPESPRPLLGGRTERGKSTAWSSVINTLKHCDRRGLTGIKHLAACCYRKVINFGVETVTSCFTRRVLFPRMTHVHTELELDHPEPPEQDVMSVCGWNRAFLKSQTWRFWCFYCSGLTERGFRNGLRGRQTSLHGANHKWTKSNVSFTPHSSGMLHVFISARSLLRFPPIYINDYNTSRFFRWFYFILFIIIWLFFFFGKYHFYYKVSGLPICTGTPRV